MKDVEQVKHGALLIAYFAKAHLEDGNSQELNASLDQAERRARHFLDQDRKSMEQFSLMVQGDPKDSAALDGLMFVCSQFLFNFDCALSAAKKSATLLDPNGASAALDFVNIAEIAVLKGDDKQMLDWLKIATQQSKAMNAHDASLYFLYRMWVAIRKGESDEIKADFDSWSEATVRFRKSKDDINWIFRGAKEALARSRNVINNGQTTLLASMMGALENNNRTLPTWPESGLL